MDGKIYRKKNPRDDKIVVPEIEKKIISICDLFKIFDVYFL